MAHIYRIKCNISNKTYVGSTKMTVEQRINCHRALCKQWQLGKANFCSAYEIIETNDFQYELLEDCLIEQKKEREAYWVKVSKSEGNNVNAYIPNRSMKDWYVDNKERWCKHMRDYYHAKKAKIQRMILAPLGTSN